ncbi:topoisomerase DNA-binding C4 zinc finger domain-containing protein [Helicobacter sp. T3_23-1059]
MSASFTAQKPFYGCEHYPYCDYVIFDIDSVLWDLVCPDCGDYLRVRFGKYGKFISCNGYPYCRYTKSFRDDF